MLNLKPSNIVILLIVSLANLINKESSDVIEYLLEYNKILKAKLEKNNKRIKFTERERIRLAKRAKKLPRKKLSEYSDLLTPECLLRWYNRLVAKKYTPKHIPTWSERKETRQCVIRLICKFAEENPLWGSGRIQGALKQLGIKRSRTYVYRVMIENGFDPHTRTQGVETYRIGII